MEDQKNILDIKSERLQDILLYVRRILGWSATVLGDKLGVSRQSINKIETKKSGLSKTEYLLLRRILDDEMNKLTSEECMLPVILEVLVDNPERYSDEERNEIKSKMKLVAPTVIAEPSERKEMSSAWKGILLAGGAIVTATLITLLKGKTDD